MSKEIERKFLVVGRDFEAMATEHHEIRQGYLCRDVDHTVRVRTWDDRAYLTVKSRTVGCTRNEWEYPIPLRDALDMLAGLGRNISKTRWVVPAGDGLRWEVDVFHGRLEGLVVAEIELPSEDTPFTRPAFVGREVTGDPAYYNSNL